MGFLEMSFEESHLLGGHSSPCPHTQAVEIRREGRGGGGDGRIK